MTYYINILRVGLQLFDYILNVASGYDYSMPLGARPVNENIITIKLVS